MTWLELTQPLACIPPPCVPTGGRLILEASWKPLSDLVLRVVKEAEAPAGQAGCIDLGGRWPGGGLELVGFLVSLGIFFFWSWVF